MIRVRDIIAQASDATLTPVQDILGKSRFQPHVRVRFAVCMVARENGRSLCEIGRILNRDHTTILNAVRRGDELEARGGEFAALVQNLRLRVTGQKQPRVFVPETPREPELPALTADMDTGQRDELNRHRGSLLLAHAIQQARAA